MGDVAAFPSGPQTFSFAELVNRAAHEARAGLQQFVDNPTDQTDAERKISLLKYVFKTKQRLLRLAVLGQWCRQMPLVERCQQVEGTLSHHDTSFTQAADSLFFLHESLQQARAPVYDIPTAAEVLLTGGYNRLPKCIEELGGQSLLVGDEREETLEKLDTVLRSRLLDVDLPPEFSSVKVQDGRVLFQVDGEFEVHLTLGYQGNLSHWRVLVLKLLVGERTGTAKLSTMQEYALREELERRMAASEDPLRLLYSILHEFSLSISIDTLFRQVRSLRQGRWKDAIRFEVIPDGTTGVQPMSVQQNSSQGLRSQNDAESELSLKPRGLSGLRIWYWLDQSKASVGGDLSSAPSLRIEPGLNQHISCLHQPSVIDPDTEMEAKFVLDQSCIDLEQLLLKAITCNIHSRLLEALKGFRSCPQLWRVESDVILKPSCSLGVGDNSLSSVSGGAVSSASPAEECSPSGSRTDIGEEVLCVRAYGQSYMALGISIRNGRFLLHAPSSLLRQSVVAEMEEALNHGLTTPVDVFISLRSKSLLQLFASNASALNLKLYEREASDIRLPEGLSKPTTDMLFMGFPNCGGNFFLFLQLDGNFMPVFNLLEADPLSFSDSPSCLRSGPVNITKAQSIDAGAIRVAEDIGSLSFLDQGRLGGEHKLSSELRRSIQAHRGADEKVVGMGRGESESLLTGRNGKFKADLGRLLERLQIPSSSTIRTSGTSSTKDLASVDQVDQQKFTSTVTHSQNGTNAASFQGNVGGRLSGNHKLGWYPSVLGLLNGTTNMGTASMASPRGSPKHRSHQGDQDSSLVRSPRTIGDTSASPIHLDDVIDPIPTKSSPGLLGSSNSLTSGENGPFNCSRHLRVQSRLNPNQQKNMMQARFASPLKTPSVLDSAVAEIRGSSEWMEVDDAAMLTQLSPSISSPSMMQPGVPSSTSQLMQPRSNIMRPSFPLDSNKRKRADPELPYYLPPLQGPFETSGRPKRRKVGEDGSQTVLSLLAGGHSSPNLESYVGQPYMSVVRAANEGRAPVVSYRAALVQVVRKCRLCMKHARLTRQLNGLGITYIERAGDRMGPVRGLLLKLSLQVISCPPPNIDNSGWESLVLQLDKLGGDCWQVQIPDSYYSSLLDLQQRTAGNPWGEGVEMALLSESDSHIQLSPRGLVLCYDCVEDDSVKRLVGDLVRLWKARAFVLGLQRILQCQPESVDAVNENMDNTLHNVNHEGGEKRWEVMTRSFRVVAVGPLSVWFTFTGSIPGVSIRFLVEWGSGNGTCTVHVSPDQLWPHTKYLEDCINGGEVNMLLSVIEKMAGPLYALVAAIRPAGNARAGNASPGSVPSASMHSGTSTKGVSLVGALSNTPAGLGQTRPPPSQSMSSAAFHVASAPSGPGRGTVPGPVPNSLLPTDVAIIMRHRFWVRVIYRKQFSVDMRCFAGDHVWLQPSPPPRSGGPSIGGSLPCPQFRPFVTELVAASMSSAEAPTGQSPASTSAPPSGSANWTPGPGGSSRTTLPPVSTRMAVPGSGPMMIAPSRGVSSGASLGVQHGSRSELNTTILGMGDDGGYGGAWVPLSALKKVLRSTLRYLGVLWLFAQFPGILREVLGSILSQNEGALQSIDLEQPALRFFIGNYVFAASMHRDKLILQVVNWTRYHQQQQLPQKQQAQTSGPDLEYTSAELAEISEFFQRRVASEPYEASRMASFVTMLTFPIPVVREFLGLFSWEKECQLAAQSQGIDSSPVPKPRVELCLECRQGQSPDGGAQEPGSIPAVGTSIANSSILYKPQLRQVDFTLTVHLDLTSLPFPMSQAGGASWLPLCVAVRLRYAFGDTCRVSLLSMDGSHGGGACWSRPEDWERCIEKVGRAVETSGGGGGQEQGRCRLRTVAESVQITLQSALQQLRKVATSSPSLLTNSIPTHA